MLFSYVLLGIPGDLLPDKQRWIEVFKLDKILHFILFFVQVLTIAYGSVKQYRAVAKSGYTVAAILITLFIAAVSEITQEYCFINRYGSFWDFLADAAGCLLGFLVYWWWDRNRLLKKQDI